MLSAIFGGLIALGGFKYFENENPSYNSFQDAQNVRFSSFVNDTSFTVPKGLNFVYAADVVTPAVVHIRSTYQGTGDTYASDNPLEDFFRYFREDGNQQRRERPRRGQGFGSGVIISSDGYVVTNNHVIDNADNIEVTLPNGKRLDARLIGTDPTTDLALVKINARDLPFVRFGDSNSLRIGEWVLAVGNPFAHGTPTDLTSTVTAGIVSAKGRNIGILSDSLRIESFIQTDAAVNPGNSGGALVNLKGELIGINTAIASPTGAYAGYSFAVPVSLVQKVADDLREFGVVQRALLGVRITDINADLAKREGIEEYSGVYIMEVNSDGAAESSGIQKGDIITMIDGKRVTTVSQLQERIAQYRPGDEVEVTVNRNGKIQQINTTLKSLNGDTNFIEKETTTTLEGAEFENVSDKMAQDLGINGGVIIRNIEDGKWKNAGFRKEFIITQVDKSEIADVNDLVKTLNNRKGDRILILGMFPDGERTYFNLDW